MCARKERLEDGRLVSKYQIYVTVLMVRPYRVQVTRSLISVPVVLSYSYKTGITTGFVKGTESSDITKLLQQLTSCSAEVGHPLLLPIIILSHDLSSKNDKRQREARDWLRRLENAITLRNEIDEKEVYSDFDVDGINRDLVECHSRVLWKRPQAYQEIVKEVKEAMTKFRTELSDERKEALASLDSSMVSRLEFYRVKLTGMEHYIHTTLERLHIQRQAVSSTGLRLLI